LEVQVLKFVISIMRTAILRVVLAGVLAGAVAGPVPVAAAAPAPLAVTTTCAPLGAAGPGYNASIGNRQNGQRVCIEVSEKLRVSLSAPSAVLLRWAPIHVSPVGILTATPSNVVTVLGVTATTFVAVREGTAVLTSHRRACLPPPKSSLDCGPALRWKVMVVVVDRGAGN
jgi:hypothetical protein